VQTDDVNKSRYYK